MADGERVLRRDAARNAERLLAAAVRTGLAEGRHVPLATVAAEAGVGVGTLYRRYPNREALVEALAARAYRLLMDVAAGALGEEGSGLDTVRAFLERSFELRDDLVLPLHGAQLDPGAESARLRDELADLIAQILDRGHRDGTVRADVTGWTVVRFGAMLAQPMTSVAGWTQSAAEQREVFLRGIAAG